MKYYCAFLIAFMVIVSNCVHANTDASDADNSQKSTIAPIQVNNKAANKTDDSKKETGNTGSEKTVTEEDGEGGQGDNQTRGTREFAGLQFGVGLSLTIDSGTRQRVETAELVNGVVRVTNENDALARIMLESHYFFTPDFGFGISTGRSLFGVESGNWGWGPFVAVQPGSKEIIEAIGFGFMLGFKRNGDAVEQGSSWNFGLGYVVDPNVQVLGDGITANAGLPEDEEAVRFKEVSQSGLLVLISFSF